LPLLETTELSVRYGGIVAVDRVTIRVEEGQLVGLIGPNGAGKTSFIDGLTGFVRTTGNIIFDGQEIGQLPAHRRAMAGLVRTWQTLELFDDLTVADNLRVAAERPRPGGVLADILAPNWRKRSSVVDETFSVLGIEDLANRLPTELSQGQRKLVGVARALATRPRLVLMDEPAAGLDTSESVELGRRLRAIVDRSTTVVLVDHDMPLVLNVCDYIYVVEFGQLIAQGTPTQIRTDERVITAYLGESARTETAAKAFLSDVPADFGQTKETTAGQKGTERP
jgi:branched-chain amino acid transport system ATP-binding protein